ncbi:MAG: VOC family protein [Prochlorotrichaceae cyanobacterium]
MHHISIRTADIHQAIVFYELLGFGVTDRFTTGATLACWMEGRGGRIELIQIPQPRSAPDAFGDEHYTGYYHISFDLTQELTDPNLSLEQWLQAWSDRVEQQRQQSDRPLAPLRVLLPPQQQMINDKVYEVTFVADNDGLPLEFIKSC